jgi:hypothetical protein
LCVFVCIYLKVARLWFYLAAFFITTWLELIGTAVGTWKWAAIDPVLGLPQGNPPSGVAAWYCLVDAVAISGAPVILGGFKNMHGRLKFVKAGKDAYQGAGTISELFQISVWTKSLRLLSQIQILGNVPPKPRLLKEKMVWNEV